MTCCTRADRPFFLAACFSQWSEHGHPDRAQCERPAPLLPDHRPSRPGVFLTRMTPRRLLQIGAVLAALASCDRPLGGYMARVFTIRSTARTLPVGVVRRF